MSRKEIVLGNTSTINSESIMKQLCQVKIECNDQLIESFDKKDSLVKYLLLRRIFLFDLMASIDKKEINVDEMISRLTIEANQINEFYITGADATACVKSTCFNMAKANYTVHVISDCVTSYDLRKMDEMLTYYKNKGCEVKALCEYVG